MRVPRTLPTIRVLGLLLGLLALAACGHRDFRSDSASAFAFVDRAIEERQGELRLRAALPTADEVEALTGLDLHEQGVQPLWLEVVNNSDEGIWAALWSVDRDYFSPAEVAYSNRRGFSGEGYDRLERWILETAMPRRIPPGETRSGFVYTNLTPGTKGFNVDLFSPTSAYNFTMFVDVPGFTPDYRLVDFEALYAASEIVDVAAKDLLDLLDRALPCCATGPDGSEAGMPLNLVFVGSGKALRRSLMRGEWRETQAQEKSRDQQSQQYFDGRTADGRFFIERADGDARLVVDIWLSPWRVDGQPLWVAQTYFREEDSPLIRALRRGAAAVEQTALLSRFIGEAISADVDSAQVMAMQNFWYNQAVQKVGFQQGVGVRSADDPGVSFDGLGFITNGWRGILYLSETPVPFGDAEFLSESTPETKREDGPATP